MNHVRIDSLLRAAVRTYDELFLYEEKRATLDLWRYILMIAQPQHGKVRFPGRGSGTGC